MKVTNFPIFSILFGVMAALAMRCPASPAVLGYYDTFDGSYQSMVSYAGAVDQISFDTFTISPNGVILGDIPANALALAKANHCETYACIYYHGSLQGITANSAVTSATIANILALLRANSFTGINIDFEGIPSSERGQFSDFIHLLATELHVAGFKLIISAPTETRDNPNNSWSGAFDYSRLGSDADTIQIMTYDEHGPWSSPGPVAGIDWVTSVIRYALTVIRASKISLGLPAYGYDWNITAHRARAISWKNITGLYVSTRAVPQHDPVSAEPYLNYVASDGSKHVVWYEDAAGIEQDANLAATLKLAGVSVWALGKEDATFWQAVKEGYADANDLIGR